MQFFKITYMLSGKYKSIYQARIVLWENERVKIRDIDDKEYLLKEEYIKSIVRIDLHKKSEEEKQISNRDEQQQLFSLEENQKN